jgi:hypothetical protein
MELFSALTPTWNRGRQDVDIDQNNSNVADQNNNANVDFD